MCRDSNYTSPHSSLKRQLGSMGSHFLKLICHLGRLEGCGVGKVDFPGHKTNWSLDQARSAFAVIKDKWRASKPTRVPPKLRNQKFKTIFLVKCRLDSGSRSSRVFSWRGRAILNNKNTLSFSKISGSCWGSKFEHTWKNKWWGNKGGDRQPEIKGGKSPNPASWAKWGSNVWWMKNQGLFGWNKKRRDLRNFYKKPPTPPNGPALKLVFVREVTKT